MVNLPLYNKGAITKYSQIDEDDYEKFKNDRWNLHNAGYAISTKGKLLHRLIMNASNGIIVDHINGDKLDNKKNNLRIVSRSHNSHNKIKKEGLTSKFIGVSFRSDKNTWRCSISHDYKLHQNSFEKEEHAAYWYDLMALTYYGPDAKINGIDTPDDFVEPNKIIKKLPTGVTINGKKYIARVSDKYLGSFETIQEAENKYNEEKNKIKKTDQKINRNKEGISIIIANKNQEILVDDDKYHELIQYKWRIDNNGYALGKTDKLIRMHRYLLQPKADEIIDHINHNRLDNRISNLRICNSQINNHNKKKRNNLTSKYIGVHKRQDKYIARINKDGKQTYIGIYASELDAVKAYNKIAFEIYGEYANLNVLQ